jgi:hypothetical protein
MSNIYILELENSKYYIGRTDSYHFTLKDHTENKWTAQHKPIAILKFIPNTDIMDEEKYLALYMLKYGMDSTRTSQCKEVELTAETKVKYSQIMKDATTNSNIHDCEHHLSKTNNTVDIQKCSLIQSHKAFKKNKTKFLHISGTCFHLMKGPNFFITFKPMLSHGFHYLIDKIDENGLTMKFTEDGIKHLPLGLLKIISFSVGTNNVIFVNEKMGTSVCEVIEETDEVPKIETKFMIEIKK